MKLKKAYYYLFYKIYKSGVAVSDDALNEWKPLCTILLLQVFLIVEVFTWITIFTKNRFSVAQPRLTFFSVVAILGIANYMFFLHKNSWKKYIKEFKVYDKSTPLGGILVFLLILIIVASPVFGFYRLSLIEWNQY